jgi:hypothetical protein
MWDSGHRIMIRVLFTIFAFLSLLLFGAGIGMWVFGKWRDMSLTHVSIDRTNNMRWLNAITCVGGRMMLWDSQYQISDTDRAGWDLQIKPSIDYFRDWRYLSASNSDLYRRFGFLGMEYDWDEMRYRSGFESRMRYIKVPFSWLSLFFAIAPALWTYRRLYCRIPLGHCLSCGYDLRATPDRCPECGLTSSKQTLVSL